MEQKNTAVLPLVFGIIGACVAIYFTLTGVASAGALGKTLGWIAVILGLVFSFFAKTKAKLCAIFEFISALIIFILFFMTSFTNWFGWIALILFALAGIYALKQNPEEASVTEQN